MGRMPAVIILLGCFGLAIAHHRIKKTKILSGKRDVLNFPKPSNTQFNSPTSTDVEVQPPSYMSSLLNQVLDLKAGGHERYLNVYPSSWTTNQVNSELTVDVQFTALVNNQIVRCSGHISASMPPSNTDNPTMVQDGTTLQCSPSSRVTQSYRPPSNLYPRNGYQINPYPGGNVPRAPFYNPISNYFLPRGPQVVYRTKLVPIKVPTLINSAPQLQPYPGGYYQPTPVNNPLYPQMVAPIEIPQYNGIPFNSVMPYNSV